MKRNENMDDITRVSEATARRAREIVEELGIVAIWKAIGADINLVGSLKTGLMMKHRDVDFHIYSSPLDIAASFSAMAKLAANPAIVRIEYGNLMDTEEQCLEWHAWYRDQERNGELWQIDMIHILRGSKYDGHMEAVAERIMKVLTPELKQTILRLKYDTPDEVKIPGIEYYVAAIRDGVTDYAALENWRRLHAGGGVVDWMP